MREEDFYAHQSYVERAADNLAKWLGLPNLSTFDVVILLPLLPALAILISWWLPWERWLWKRFPKMISGPYFLYCAFVLWHFQARWWFIALAVGVGAVLIVGATIEGGKPWRRGPS
jgi:hypothetical protein